MTTPETGPLSWRDVYRALGEMETKILDAIDRSVAPLAAAQTDHETRLRSIEQHGTADAREALDKIVALRTEFESVKTEVEAIKNKGRGIEFTATTIAKVVFILAAVTGIASALADKFIH